MVWPAVTTMRGVVFPIRPRLVEVEGANRSRLIVAPVLRVRLARVNWALLLPTVPESAEMLFAPLARVTAPRVSVELKPMRP